MCSSGLELELELELEIEIEYETSQLSRGRRGGRDMVMDGGEREYV